MWSRTVGDYYGEEDDALAALREREVIFLAG